MYTIVSAELFAIYKAFLWIDDSNPNMIDIRINRKQFVLNT